MGCTASMLGRDWVICRETTEQVVEQGPQPTKRAGYTGWMLNKSPDAQVLMAEALLSNQPEHECSEETLEQAKALMDSAIQKWPEYSRAFLIRGRVHFMSEDWKAAVKDLSTAIQIQPGLGQAFYLRSQAFIRMSLLEKAIQDYKRALVVDPDNSQLKTLKAEIAKAHSMAAHPASKDVDSAKHNDTHSGKSEQAAKAAAKKEEAAAKKEKESTDTVLVIDQSPPGVKHGVHATPAGGIGKRPPPPKLHVESEEPESEDPFAGVDTPNDVACANQKLCMVCMDAERGGLRLRPCLHAALCLLCAQNLMNRGFGCPICETRIDSLERGQFMCTFTEDTNQGLAKSIKELAAQRRARAEANGGVSSTNSSPDTSPSLLMSGGFIGSPPSGSSTPSVLSSMYSPATHYTPGSSRPTTTTLATVAEVQESPWTGSLPHPMHLNADQPPEASTPQQPSRPPHPAPTPLGQPHFTPHSNNQPPHHDSPRLNPLTPRQDHSPLLLDPVSPSTSQQQQEGEQQPSPLHYPRETQQQRSQQQQGEGQPSVVSHAGRGRNQGGREASTAAQPHDRTANGGGDASSAAVPAAGVPPPSRTSEPGMDISFDLHS